VTPLGWIGVWLLVAGVAVIVVEGVLAVVLGMAVAKRSRALQERIETGRGLIEADLKKLREAFEETQRLWRPYRRALRWLRHPITIALMQSYAGRRAGR
jgi:hypothetical protein